MVGKQGYGVQNPACHATKGRFKKGVHCPDRYEYLPGNYKGYPSKEAFLKSKKEREELNQVKEDKAIRRQTIAAEARDIQDIAREFSERAMQALVNVMENENAADSAIIAAAEAILSRGYGKPTVTTLNANLNASVKPSEVDAETLDLRIAEALNRVERLTSRETKAAESEERPSDLRQYN